MINLTGRDDNGAEIKFAVIGRNFVVDWMLEAAAHLPRLVFSGVCSRDPAAGREFGEKHGCGRVFKGVDELAAADDVDMVYIATPNLFHCEQTVQMLLSGKHVLCEKPIAPSVGDFIKMRDASLKSKKVLMEAMVPLHTPALDTVKKLIDDISPIRHAMLNFCQYSSRYDLFKMGKVENAFKPWLCNGALADIGVYCIAVAEELFGMPKDIIAHSYFLPESIDGEGSVTAVYSDMIVNLNYSKIVDSVRPSEICGERGNIMIDSLSRPHVITHKPRKCESVIINTVKYDKNGSVIPDMVYELETFISMIDGIQLGRTEIVKKELDRCMRVLSFSDEIRRLSGITYQKV